MTAQGAAVRLQGLERTVAKQGAAITSLEQEVERLWAEIRQLRAALFGAAGSLLSAVPPTEGES